jgi:hypothetical protein
MDIHAIGYTIRFFRPHGFCRAVALPEQVAHDDGVMQ